MSVTTDKPRLYRVRQDRLIVGVAAGIGEHLGISVTLVRLAFVVLLGLSGLGLLLYAAFWAVVPLGPAGGDTRQHSVDRRHPWRISRRELGKLLPFAAIAVGVLLIQSTAFDLGADASTVGWLGAIIAVGAGAIWHQSIPERRHQGSSDRSVPWLGAVLVDSDRRTLLLRFIGGGVLVTVGIIGVVGVYSEQDLATVLNGVLFALVGLAGVGLVAAPVVWRTVTQLRAEREGRIREQERAELAAMVHDQVLHTLALIQRNAGDVKSVQRLARGQERSLRNWLYKSTGSSTERFAAGLEQAVAEVEDTYSISVESVVVGDRETDDRIGALVAAGREALVNAARHAQVDTVSLYAEVEPEQISVFIRDRGVGFDLAAVEDQRHGVRGSIIGRMVRHGGRADIRSEPGNGTEVRLILPMSR